MFLLDTNHCSYALLSNTQILDRLANLGDESIATCTIVKGELIDMAARSQQRQANLALVQRFLLGLYIYPIDETTAEIYGNLKAAVFDRYAPKDKAQRRRTNMTQLGIGENDLWIAAVAIQHQLTLVTADRDFQRIQAVQPFELESWILTSSESG
ncbi:type II toxin-antitoxin system VapC family toxin [Microcoleus sp.]|uniref:type II toxin-antitoxin system VapC family toxin n=1 Tax=Microcoleus sp. TaxID=44472 RepID=UPI003524F075